MTKTLNENQVVSSTETNEGILEVATDTEVLTGTATDKIVTPAGYTAGNKDQIGGPVSKSYATNYEATENGFLHGSITMSGTGNGHGITLTIYTDGTTTPTTLVGTVSTSSNVNFVGGSATYCVPIVKGNYYRVDRTLVGSTSSTLYFTSLT